MKVASLENQKNRLDALIKKRNAINEQIKEIQSEIMKKESQEILKTLTALNLSPKQAIEMLKNGNPTIPGAIDQKSKERADGVDGKEVSK
jgi:hypothetical protein